MGFERKVFRAAFSAVLMLSPATLAAAPAPEPLIITKNADPDSGFVAAPEANLTVVRTRAGGSDAPTLEEAMETFGRAVGQAIRVEQQAMEAACRSTPRPKAGSSEVYAWQSRCNYNRH